MPEAPTKKTNWSAVLEDNPWVVFLAPFIVFMIFTQIEPTPEKAGGAFGLVIPYSHYPWAYAAKIVLTLAAVGAVWPGYRWFPFRVSPLAIVVGVVGVVVWVGLCKLQLETRVIGPFLSPLLDNPLGKTFGLAGMFDPEATRSAFNPFEHMADRRAAWAFLAVRFFGLALVVPLIEEFFLRGFIMRFVMARDWWEVPFGTVTTTAVVVGTVFPMLMHPAELVAAAVWFSMITWLMVRTKNIWDCVAAHAVTNFLLGVYVVASGDWHLM